MANTVRALWVGSYEATTSRGVLLVPCETVLEIPAGEAEESDNWRVATPPTPPTTTSTGSTD